MTHIIICLHTGVLLRNGYSQLLLMEGRLAARFYLAQGGLLVDAVSLVPTVYMVSGSAEAVISCCHSVFSYGCGYCCSQIAQHLLIEVLN